MDSDLRISVAVLATAHALALHHRELMHKHWFQQAMLFFRKPSMNMEMALTGSMNSGMVPTVVLPMVI